MYSSYPSAISGRHQYSSPDLYPSYRSPSLRFREALGSAKANNSYRTQILANNTYSRPLNVRSVSMAPIASISRPMRSMIRDAFDDPPVISSRNKWRSRDDLIDSIIHTRTPEHRPMPGFFDSTCWEERRHMNIDCDKVYPGIYLANGETVKNIDYLKNIGTTHVLNTAERHVPVTPSAYPAHDINYMGFHVDDHPTANIARYFTRSSDFIDGALRRGGNVVVNCMMGWSRSASVVAAYLMDKKGMTANQALEHIRQHRPIRPNPGFLQQLADYENLKRKRLVWE